MDDKNTLVDKVLCKACLCVDRSLQKVTDKKVIQYLMDILNEIPLCNVPQVCPAICWECTALLNKAVSFREQVKDSYRILQNYTNDKLLECLLTDVSRAPRLRVHARSPVDLPPSGPQELQLVCVKEEMKNDWHDRDDDPISPTELEDLVPDVLEEKIEIDPSLDGGSRYYDDDPMPPTELEDLVPDVLEEKIEIDPSLDGGSRYYDDDPMPPTELENEEVKIKIEIESVKPEAQPAVASKSKKAKKTDKQVEKILKLKEKTKAKKRKSETESKIITIELSYEEMLEERERDATRDSYLKAQFKCESCLVAFNYSRSLQAHRAAKHAPELGDYSCPICKTVIASVDSFTAHYKRHTRRYECSICHKRTQDMKVMQQHYYGAHEISLKQYQCDLCGKISNSVDTHRYHRDSHKARVPCPDCDKSFSHRAGLMNHRIAVHELKNAFPCTVCEKVFRWKASLKRHTEKHHAKEKSAPAYCAQCGVSFSSVCSFQRHMKNSLKHVTPEQLKFICDHCGRRFADKTKLRDHIEEKHLHKTYRCHICHKPSKNRVGLDQHVRNVHRGRPHNKMCHHCGKGFPTKVQLESHIRTHTGERPFICEFCPTTFSQQSNLYKHNRQVHLNIKSKRYLCKKKEEDKAPSGELLRPVTVLHFSPQRGFVM